MHANDRHGLEQLCRYGLRPPLAQSRLALDVDGQVHYRMKRTFADGTHTLRFTPRELVLRLCALVPPPRFHMVRYHGLFAAHARGRAALTGRRSGDRHAAGATPAGAAPPRQPQLSHRCLPEPAPPADAASSSEQAVIPSHHPECHHPDHDTTVPAAPGDRDGDATVPAAPDDPDRPRRLAWAELLKRTFRLDVLVCGRCGGQMGLVAVILDPAVAAKIVRHLGLAPRAPPWPATVAPDRLGGDAPLFV